MEKTIRLDYPAIYKELRELREFLYTDVLPENQNSRQQIQSVVGEMNGKVNDRFLHTNALNEKRTASAAQAIINLIDYMETSAKEMEAEDLRLSQGIHIEEGAQ